MLQLTPSAKNVKTDDNIEFLQQWSAVAADTLVEIGMAVISDFLSLDEHLPAAETTARRVWVTTPP
jgi:hypothetical protein